MLKAIIQECGTHAKLRKTLDQLEYELQNGVILDDETILRRVVGGIYDSLTTEGDLTRLPILVVYSHPEGARLLTDKIIKGRKSIVEYVQRRQNEGAFTKSIDASFFVQVMATAFIMYALGRDLNNLLPFTHFSRDDIIEQLVSLLLYGIARCDPGETQKAKEKQDKDS